MHVTYRFSFFFNQHRQAPDENKGLVKKNNALATCTLLFSGGGRVWSLAPNLAARSNYLANYRSGQLYFLIKSLLMHGFLKIKSCFVIFDRNYNGAVHN